MERISLDFKGPLPSASGNSYLSIAIDEYSQFPFAFPCKDMTAATVIRCLDKLYVVRKSRIFLFRQWARLCVWQFQEVLSSEKHFIKLQ